MRIVSFNVNGIRSATTKGLVDWIQQINPDIICFQEIKANESDIPEDFKKLSDYHQFWKPASKKGYSGVGILSKIKPREVLYSLNLPEYDEEGRFLLLEFQSFYLMSAYFPSGTTGDVRQSFKEKFLEDFKNIALEFKKQGKRLIITGDVNVCHKPIDIHNPISNKNSSGFLPHERQWFDEFLSLGYSDALRLVSSEPHQYTWWTFRAGARDKNLGWRIDYHLVDNELVNKVNGYKIHSDIRMSDHCPIELEIDILG
jgi:exodeoxyribonuclease-3